MCGIFGVFNYKEPLEVTKNEIIKGIKFLTHRGPDGEGLYISNNIGLGHRRLSIIDLEGGTQPISNEDNSIFIICNGEIYNYSEIREKSILKGHIFKTKSDSETVLHLYEEKGSACLEDLNGIFSFAIWDSNKNKLFLARDRLGIKPLFYYYTRYGIAFSSEVKSFLTLEDFRKELNPEAVKDFFSLGYVLHPRTIFKDVYNIPPGYFLEVVNGKSILKEYWDINLRRYEQGSLQDLMSLINNQIATSVRMQLVSDVPVGAFLSGGLDSSAVTYYMKRFHTDNKVMTFSIGFKEKTYSELDYAKISSDYLNTEHKQLIVSPEEPDFIENLIWHNDEPFGDTSAVPMYYVSKLARKHVKVVLSGDGGDENFGGYETYIADIISKSYRTICPKFLRRVFKKIVYSLPVTFNKVSLDYKLKRFSEGAELDSLGAHFWWRLIFTPDEQKELFSSHLKGSIDSYDPLDTFRYYFNKTEGMPILKRLSYVDYKTWLVDDILKKVDRTSMAHSLEARVPLLDHTLVELSINIPDKLKVHFGTTKYVFKRTMQDKLPSKIIWRRKSGFNAPVSHWINGELRWAVKEYLSEERLLRTGLFEPDFVNKLIERHIERKEDNGLKIWCLLNFMIWFELFIYGNKRRV